MALVWVVALFWPACAITPVSVWAEAGGAGDAPNGQVDSLCGGPGSVAEPGQAAEHPEQTTTQFQPGYGNPHGADRVDRFIEHFRAGSPFAEAERHIRTAIAYWIEHLQIPELMGQEDDRLRAIRQYASVGEFLAANPRCCYFHVRDTDGGRPGFWYRLRHNYLGLVALNKIRLQYADTGETFIVLGRVVHIDRDGRVTERAPN